MSTRIVTLLAAHPQQDALFAQHDRCARWATENEHIIREKILLHGEGAADFERICAQLEERADANSLDLVVIESLSVLGPNGDRIAQMLEHLRAKNAEVYFLKERQVLPACSAILLFNAYSPFRPAQECVYYGSTNGKKMARQWADGIGWNVSATRQRNPFADGEFEKLLHRADGKIFLIESLKVLPEQTLTGRMSIFKQMAEGGQDWFIFDQSLDSQAPNQDAALRAALVVHYPKPKARASMPEPQVLLVEWVDRKTGRNASSLRSYTREINLNPNTFFGAIRTFIKQMERHNAEHGFNATLKHFNVPRYALRYALEWYADSESRKRLK
jgi:hypothetical protein